MAKLKQKEDLSKESVVQEYKSSDDLQEAVEQVTSNYVGEGFDLCKKQIVHLHPELDIQNIQIDPELVEEENDKLVDSPLPSQQTDQCIFCWRDQCNPDLNKMYFFLHITITFASLSQQSICFCWRYYD